MLNVISLGAGVQSSTLALMAARGEIGPMPDAAIFADTGDEKRRTYQHLDELAEILPYPLIRVRRSEMSLSESTLAHYAGTGGFDQTPPLLFSRRHVGKALLQGMENTRRREKGSRDDRP